LNNILISGVMDPVLPLVLLLQRHQLRLRHQLQHHLLVTAQMSLTGQTFLEMAANGTKPTILKIAQIMAIYGQTMTRLRTTLAVTVAVAIQDLPLRHPPRHLNLLHLPHQLQLHLRRRSLLHLRHQLQHHFPHRSLLRLQLHLQHQLQHHLPHRSLLRLQLRLRRQVQHHLPAIAQISLAGQTFMEMAANGMKPTILKDAQIMAIYGQTMTRLRTKLAATVAVAIQDLPLRHQLQHRLQHRLLVTAQMSLTGQTVLEMAANGMKPTILKIAQIMAIFSQTMVRHRTKLAATVAVVFLE